ncbi:hypothetical protein [Alteromonas sediminis]|uniref:hypothetical protein n=1 Tax=Alteromonas sediminis TaxID=2259342 RepID=UPI001404DEDC|nr:hypothetical protein [Alteromonas sediminis]
MSAFFTLHGLLGKNWVSNAKTFFYTPVLKAFFKTGPLFALSVSGKTSHVSVFDLGIL